MGGWEGGFMGVGGAGEGQEDNEDKAAGVQRGGGTGERARGALCHVCMGGCQPKP